MYEVERILDHKGQGHSLKLLVKWKDYSEKWNSWEPIENMSGAVELVNEYMQSKDEKIAQLEFSQTTGTAINDEPNFICPQQVLIYVESQRKAGAYRHDTPVRQFLEEPTITEQQAIYLYLRREHFYVMWTKQSELHIADGSNHSTGDTGLNKDLLKWFGAKPIVHTLKQQTRIDHCASSAATIILEVLRKFRRNEEFEETIVVPTKQLNQLRRNWHKGDSQSTDHKENIFTISNASKRCKKCNKMILNRKKRLAHSKQCNQ